MKTVEQINALMTTAEIEDTIFALSLLADDTGNDNLTDEDITYWGNLIRALRCRVVGSRLLQDKYSVRGK